MIEKIGEAVAFLQKATNNFKPTSGIILGTGLGALIKDVNIDFVLSYDEIPHFPVSTVESHHGKLIFGKLEEKRVVVMQGRFHFYEGYTMQEITFPVRVMKMLGIQHLFVSNAAGGLNPKFSRSDLMIINDHIDLMPANPLTGKNLDALGDRFPDMSQPYNKEMIAKAKAFCAAFGISAHEGVYAALSGPNLETPAEYRYLSIIGADAVGMSTVPEVIVANHMKLPVFAVSVITDLCYGEIEPISVPQIIAAAMAAEPGMTKVIKALVAECT